MTRPRGTDALAGAIPRLRAAGVPDPARDARRLLAHALGVAPDRLTLVLGDPLPPETAAAFAALIDRRAARAPLSHLTGERAFFGRRFAVSPDVLDPRPETECLVAAALDTPFATVLDLGTGSGCILLSLLAECPGTRGIGTDLSTRALAVARRNAARLGLVDRAGFRRGSWFEPLGQADPAVDLIVSNPPYIAADEMPGLAPEVRDHEPPQALTDGADGLVAYRAIAAGCRLRLVPGGHLLLEIGPTQGATVAGLLRAAGLRDVVVLPDLDGRDRVVKGRAPGMEA